jgi:lipid-A-disaccharide synthase
LVRSLSDLRANGTRFIHLVAPQVWAWKPRRAKSIARSVDRLLCFFPFEPPLFERHGGHADFVGHPLSDLIPENLPTASVEQELSLTAEDRLLLLAPGSREREVRALLPIFDRVAEDLIKRLDGRLRVAIAKATDLDRAIYREFSDFPLVEGRFRELCARAHAGLIASGTATLEAGIIGLPHVIAYRMDPITAMLTRHVLLIDHVGLPNIIHGKRVCPEVLQDQLDERRVGAHLMTLWQGPRREQCLSYLRRTRELLGGGGAMGRIASIIEQELRLGQRRKDTLEMIDAETIGDREKSVRMTEIPGPSTR